MRLKLCRAARADAGGCCACRLRPSRRSQLQGWVEAETVFVSPDEQGRVEVLKVRQGDKVEKGDLLFTLDDDLQKADVVVKQAAVQTAQQNFDRAEELLKSKSGTQKALDDAWANLRQAKANLEWSKTRLARRRALSPAAGSIQEVYFRPGETVPPGRPVVALLPPSNLKIRFFAPETELATIKIGETVDGHLRRLRGRADRESEVHRAKRRIYAAGDLQHGGARQARLSDRGAARRAGEVPRRPAGERDVPKSGRKRRRNERPPERCAQRLKTSSSMSSI